MTRKIQHVSVRTDEIKANGSLSIRDNKCVSIMDSSDSKWLRNHIIWAMHNNHKITLTPTKHR